MQKLLRRASFLKTQLGKLLESLRYPFHENFFHIQLLTILNGKLMYRGLDTVIVRIPPNFLCNG